MAEGADVDAVCRQLEVSVQTYQRWRSQFKAMRPEDVVRLKALEKENGEGFQNLGSRLSRQTRTGLWEHRRVLLSFAYLAYSCVLELLDRTGEDEDHNLHERRFAQQRKAERDSPDSFARAHDRAVDQTVRVTVLAVSVVMLVTASVRAACRPAHDACSSGSARPRRTCSMW